MEPLAKDGSLDIHSRDPSYRNVQFYWLVTGGEQETQSSQAY